MRITGKSLSTALFNAALYPAMLLLASFSPTVALAQAQPFDHIVVIFQENRTPDNLFGSAQPSTLCGGQADFEPGVDIQDWGNNKLSPSGKTCFASLSLSSSINPGHQHGDFKNMWDSNNQDTCSPNPQCYAYVPRSDVQPYFDIATNYGFANYMFQTNEGPSFEAHQFIFSGTSAPNGTPLKTIFITGLPRTIQY